MLIYRTVYLPSGQNARAEEFVIDDADSLKNVANDLGLQHQVCRTHVSRHAHNLIEELGTKVMDHSDPVPWEWCFCLDNMRLVHVDKERYDQRNVFCGITEIHVLGNPEFAIRESS